MKSDKRLWTEPKYGTWSEIKQEVKKEQEYNMGADDKQSIGPIDEAHEHFRVHKKRSLEGKVPSLADGGTRKTYSTGAQKEDDSKTEGKGAYHLLPVLAIQEVAEIFRKGAIKYQEWNWAKGLPLSRFMDSMKRHTDQEWEGLIDERHAAQAAWNALCYLDTLIRIERGILPSTLDDRPSFGAPEDPNYRPAGPGFGLSSEEKGKWLNGKEDKAD